VTAARTYTASAYARIPADGETSVLRAYVSWYNSSNSLISTSEGALTTVEDVYNWQRLVVTATAPTGAVGAKVGVRQPLAGTAGQVFLIDAVMLENASYAKPYQDELAQLQENVAMDNALRRVPVPHLTGAELNADISLGSLVFNTVDENKVVWVITQVDGWWTLPESQMTVIERGFGDGQYDVRGRFTSRAITLTGSILPPDRTALPAARAKLIDAVNLVKRGDWLKLDEDPVKAAWVRLATQPTIDTLNQRGRTDFTVMLRAPDPIKYKWTEGDPDGYAVASLAAYTVVGDAATTNVVNEGTTDVTAIFELLGPLVGPNATLTNMTTGDSINIVGTLRPARSLTVTTRATDSSGSSTLTLSTPHDLVSGDLVTVGGVATGYNGNWEVDVVPTSTSVSIVTGRAVETSTSSSGSVSMDADLLEIDTYDREVALNGLVEGSRGNLDALIDWITLQPGDNEIELRDDNQTPLLTREWSRTSNVATVKTLQDHLIFKGDTVKVAGITSGPNVATAVVTNTTANTVSYASVGSDVATTSTGPVITTVVGEVAVTAVAYNASTNVVTLTAPDHDVLVEDVLTVSGGDTTWGTPAFDVAVDTSNEIEISQYGFTTSSDLLRLRSASSYLTTGGTVAVGNFTVNATTNVITCTAHGLSVNQQVSFTTSTGGVLPGGLSATVMYYVISVATANEFTVSTALGGSIVDITTTGTGTHSVRRGVGWYIGDTLAVSGMGGDFDGYFTISAIDPTWVTVVAPSGDSNVTEPATAPQSATMARVYRATAVTATTVSYKKIGPTNATLTTTSVTSVAGGVYRVGNPTGRVLYRSGWLA
jgi:hypothetical protein